MVNPKSSYAPILKTFCTTREAADLLGVSVGTVQIWVENGLLQAWKTSGGHRRVVRESVDRLLHKSSAHPVIFPDVPSSAPQKTNPLRVMVVDDDHRLLRLYQVKIDTWTLAVELACFDNAVQALLALGRRVPDLLITDLQMPGVDGFEMLRVVKGTPELRDLRVAVVSGLDVADIEAHGGVPEGVAVFPKPIPFPRLFEIASEIARSKAVA